MRYHEPHRAVRAYALAKQDSRGWCVVLELVRDTLLLSIKNLDSEI